MGAVSSFRWSSYWWFSVSGGHQVVIRLSSGGHQLVIRWSSEWDYQFWIKGNKNSAQNDASWQLVSFIIKPFQVFLKRKWINQLHLGPMLLNYNCSCSCDTVLRYNLVMKSEVWHALTVSNGKAIKEVDKAYLRSIPTSQAGLELERRLLYLWHIFRNEKKELISRFSAA